TARLLQRAVFPGRRYGSVGYGAPQARDGSRYGGHPPGPAVRLALDRTPTNPRRLYGSGWSADRMTVPAIWLPQARVCSTKPMARQPSRPAQYRFSLVTSPAETMRMSTPLPASNGTRGVCTRGG